MVLIEDLTEYVLWCLDNSSIRRLEKTRDKKTSFDEVPQVQLLHILCVLVLQVVVVVHSVCRQTTLALLLLASYNRSSSSWIEKPRGKRKLTGRNRQRPCLAKILRRCSKWRTFGDSVESSRRTKRGIYAVHTLHSRKFWQKRFKICTVEN